MTIEAKIILDTISPQSGVRLTTLQLKYPRFIHSQLMTHRVFSRNASSSRAIPVKKIIEAVKKDPVYPIHWGQNQPGMQAHREIEENLQNIAKTTWEIAMQNAIESAEELADLGVHKQVVNRLLEPFQHIEVVLTATDFDNFFKLRLHEDSQHEIQQLAQAMKSALDSSKPQVKMYHLPYLTKEERELLNLHGGYKDLAMISAARCARVSYLNHDGSQCDRNRDFDLAERLLKDGHMSPFEHQAVSDNSKYTRYANLQAWKSFRFEIESPDNHYWANS